MSRRSCADTLRSFPTVSPRCQTERKWRKPRFAGRCLGVDQGGCMLYAPSPIMHHASHAPPLATRAGLRSVSHQPNSVRARPAVLRPVPDWIGALSAAQAGELARAQAQPSETRARDRLLPTWSIAGRWGKRCAMPDATAANRLRSYACTLHRPARRTPICTLRRQLPVHHSLRRSLPLDAKK